MKRLLAQEHHLDHGAVVAEGRTAAEFRDGGENVLHAAFAGGDLEALVVEEFAFGIFGFGHAVGDQDEACLLYTSPSPRDCS